MLKIMNIDIDIGITLLYRLWTVFAGAVLLFVIPVYLSPSEQGYYFTIASLIALQVFFELGFNFVVTQTISHEMGKVNITENLKLYGNTNSLLKIRSLIDSLHKWYIKIALTFFTVVFILGVIFFYNSALPVMRWMPVWAAVAFFSAVNLYFGPYYSVIEGFGFVAKVAKIRLIQSIFGYFVFVLVLMFGYGLYALPCISGMTAVITVFWITRTFKAIKFEPDLDSKTIEICCDEQISWKRDILPLQWKLAISWFSGYLIFQLFNPVLFKNQGAEVAGKVGLALTIFSTILSISMSWVNAKVPTISRHIANADFKFVNGIFRRLVLKSSIVNLTIIVLFDLFVIFLGAFESSLVHRLPTLDILLMLSLVSLINHLIFCMALYMRAFKDEPLLICSLVSGVIISILVFFGSLYSANVTILFYLLVTAFVSFPWVLFVFIRYRQGVALK